MRTMSDNTRPFDRDAGQCECSGPPQIDAPVPWCPIHGEPTAAYQAGIQEGQRRLVEPPAVERSELTAKIKDAYYAARDNGGTMHTAAEDAADAILEGGILHDADQVRREARLRYTAHLAHPLLEKAREEGRAEVRAAGLCRCVDVKVGEFTHVVTMRDPFTLKLVGIDVCIATEIAELWHQGVRTMASCCGHGKYPSTVGVDPPYEDRMDQLGYERLPLDHDIQSLPQLWQLPAALSDSDSDALAKVKADAVRDALIEAATELHHQAADRFDEALFHGRDPRGAGIWDAGSHINPNEKKWLPSILRTGEGDSDG